MRKKPINLRFVTTDVAAQILAVDRRQVIRWMRQGVLRRADLRSRRAMLLRRDVLSLAVALHVPLPPIAVPQIAEGPGLQTRASPEHVPVTSRRGTNNASSAYPRERGRPARRTT